MTGSVLVVTPTYNEAATLPEVVRRTLGADPDIDLLVVDDASPDGTGELADDLAAEHERVHVMHRAGKQGLGSAYRAGLGWGLEREYRVLIEMDADLSHDPASLPALVEATERADLVIGSRYVPGGRIRNWSWGRVALSRAGNRYVRIVTGLPVRDATSGFRAYRRPVLEAIGLRELRSDGYSFQVETALLSWWSGFTIREVPITFVERRSGASKISRAIVLEALWRIARWGLIGPRRSGGTHPRSVAVPRPAAGER